MSAAKKLSSLVVTVAVLVLAVFVAFSVIAGRFGTSAGGTSPVTSHLAGGAIKFEPDHTRIDYS